MNRKRIIFTSICVILLVALVSGTLAWFYINEEVTVSYGNSIFCEAGDSLEISLGTGGEDSNWSSSIDYRPLKSNGEYGTFTTVDISGDGRVLYRPTEINENQQPMKMVEAKSSLDDSSDYDYIEMVVTFRSVSQMNVYLSDESFIDPVDISIPEDPKDPKNNIYGKFSRDYIAGAMRVAVLDYTSKDLLMLWAPNSEIELIREKDDHGNYNGKYDLNPVSANPQRYAFFAETEDGAILEREVPTEYYANGTFVVDSTNAQKGWANKSPVIASLVPAAVESHAKQTVIIRIWFEGTDREAHQALAGGNVNVNLKFIGIAKKENPNQSVINDLENGAPFTGLSNGMECSVDGKVWTTTLPHLESGSVIYVRYPETEEHFASTCAKVILN